MRTHDEDLALPDKEGPSRRPNETSPLADAILSLQRAAGNAGVAAWLTDEQEEERSPVLDVVDSGGGAPLDTGTRAVMEASLGHDFSDVRVHTDGAATESARSVGASAYTVGTDVVMQSDRWAPDSDPGRRLLAHELTHVMQQRSGPVDGTAAGGGIQVSDPGDRFEREAERSADAVMAGLEPAGVATGAANSALQRQEEGEEEEPEETFT